MQKIKLLISSGSLVSRQESATTVLVTDGIYPSYGHGIKARLLAMLKQKTMIIMFSFPCGQLIQAML